MRIYFDKNSSNLVLDPLFKQRVEKLSFKRGDTVKLEIAILDGNLIETPSPTATLKFGVKTLNDFDSASFLAFQDVFSTSGDFYTANLSLNTTELNTALTGDTPTLAAMAEITISTSGNWQSSVTVATTIYNDVIKGGEGLPEEATPTDYALLSSANTFTGTNTFTGYNVFQGDGLFEIKNGVTTILTTDGNLLLDTSGITSLAWGSRIAYDSGLVASINWDARYLDGSSGGHSLDWEQRFCYDSVGVKTVDYNLGTLHNSTDMSAVSIDWFNRELHDSTSTGTPTLNWETCTLIASDETDTIHWSERALINSSNQPTVDWEQCYLNDENGSVVLQWRSADGGPKFAKDITLTVNPPLSGTDTGSIGQIKIDANYIYVCTASNVWKRVPLTTF